MTISPNVYSTCHLGFILQVIQHLKVQGMPTKGFKEINRFLNKKIN